MKNSKIILFAIILVLFCHDHVWAVDTLNHVDENNMKQGHWVYTNKIKRLSNYKDNQVVEEGNYTDDKKTGQWTFYYNNNNVKHVLTYANNRPDGYAVFYYENGNKREEGTWINNKWVGDYTYYYENGRVKNDWNYNKNGSRVGVQKYFYSNGQLMIEGEWSNGEETGKIMEYYEDGSVKSERNYDNGIINSLETKKYEPQQKSGKITVKTEKVPVEKQLHEEKVTAIKSLKIKKEKVPWDGTGDHQFFNKQGQIIREGYFENGFLINGNKFEYSSEGKKIKTSFYKDGKLIKETKKEKE